MNVNDKYEYLIRKTHIKCSGQGGWTNAGDLDAGNIKSQVDLAFEHRLRTLRVKVCLVCLILYFPPL